MLAYRPLLGRPSGVPDPLSSNDPTSGVQWVSAAMLPPIDGIDRVKRIASTTRRDDAAGDEEDVEPESGPGGALLLGMSGSAVLGVALYAPDLVAAIRRNGPRRAAITRPQPTTRRDDRAPK